MMMVTTQRSGRQPGQRFRGPVLPDGEVRDLYVVDGRITLEAQAGAETVAEGWIVPGLVDAHCHIGLDDHGPVPDEESEDRRCRTGTPARCSSGTPARRPTPGGSRRARTCPG